MRKNWWKYLLILLVLIIAVAASAIVWVSQNQGRVINELLVELNKKQPGKYEITGSHVAFFKTYPYVSIDLEDLAFYAVEADTTPIYQFTDVYVGFSFDKLFNGKLDIKKIVVENGSIDIVHFKDGTWNLLKAKASVATETPTEKSEEALALNLHEVTLNNIKLTKTDYMNDQLIEIHIEEIVAGLAWEQDSLTSHLESKLTLESLQTGGSTIFKDKHLALHFDLAYYFEQQVLHLYKSNFELEEAELFMEGDVAVDNEMDMDLHVFGRKPDFKLLLSLTPNDIYQKLKNYSNEGEVFFDGRIRGKSANGETPRIDLEFGCENAWFVQNAKEKRLDGLSFKGYYTNGAEQTLATSELYVQNLKGRPGKGIFSGDIKIKNFVKPELQVKLKADIDLTDLDEFLDLEMFPEVTGKLLIDATIDDVFDTENPNVLIRKLKDTLYTKIEMQNLNFKLDAFPHPFEAVNGRILWEGGTLIFDNFTGRLQKSDWILSGNLTNLAGILHKEKGAVTTSINIKSNRLDFKELLSFDPTLAKQNDEVITNLKLAAHFNTSVSQVLDFKHLPLGELFIDTLSMKMKHYAHALKNFHADLLIDSAQLTLKDLSGKIDESDMHLTAAVDNYLSFLDSTKINDPIALKLDFHADYLSFKDLFTYKGKNLMPEEYQGEVLKNFDFALHGNSTKAALLDTAQLPAFNLELDDLDGQFTFHKMPLRDFHASLVSNDNVLSIKDFRGKIGRSDFILAGELKHLISEEKGIAGNLNLSSSILDIDELIIYEEDTANSELAKNTAYHDSTTNLFSFPFPALDFAIDVSRVNYHKYVLDQVKAKGKLTEDHYIYIDTLQLLAADGAMGLKGYFNGSNPDSIYAKSDLYLDGLSIDKIAYKMDNFGTDYAFNETLHGKIYGTVNAVLRLHRDFTPYLEGSEAHIEAKIMDGIIENFPPMDLMAEYFGEKNVKNIKFGELNNVFDFKDNQLSIPKMEISSTLGFINISGKQSMDLDMDYFIQVPFNLISKAVKNTVFGVKNDGESTEIMSDDGKKRLFLNVRVKGTPDNYDVELKKDRRGSD